MPNRFAPRVLPDSTPRPGDEGFLERGVQAFQESREKARRRELEDEQLADYRTARDRQSILGDLEVQDELAERGFTEAALPLDIERMQEGRRERTPDFGPADVFQDPDPAPRTRFDEAELFDRDGARGLFQRFGEQGPGAAEEPVFLPGQFVAGQGFMPKAVFLDELPDTGVERELARPSRVTLGGREFEKTGETLDERTLRAAREETERLVDMGVDRSMAELSENNPALRAQLIQQAGRGRISASDLTGLGVPPALARIAERDQDMARALATTYGRPQDPTESLAERRFNRELLRESAAGYALQLFSRGSDMRQVAEAINAVEEWRGVLSPADLEQVQTQTEALSGSRPATEATMERRRNIVREFERFNSRVVEPWHQDVVDMLAGVGPDGEDMPPMSFEEIMAGYEAAGVPEDRLQQIRRFIPRTFHSTQGR